MSTRLYMVKDWEKRFESAKSREYKMKSQAYMPNKAGLGYIRIMREHDGAAIYGTWCAIICLLSRMEGPRHGYITDTGRRDGNPLDFASISQLTMIHSEIVKKTLEFCSSQQIGWLDVVYIADTDKDTAGSLPGIAGGPLPYPLPSPLPLPKGGADTHDGQIVTVSGMTGKAPAIESVLAHAAVIGMTEQDAREFFGYWTGAEWTRTDGTPMRNWKAAMVSRRNDIANRKAKEGTHESKFDHRRPAVSNYRAPGNPYDGKF